MTENGRVIGFLLEKIEGEVASIEELPACEKVLRRLHAMGLVHGDVYRHNFVVNRSVGGVCLVDFEHAREFNETQARMEIESLRDQLTEETRRRGTVIRNSDHTGKKGFSELTGYSGSTDNFVGTHKQLCVKGACMLDSSFLAAVVVSFGEVRA